MGYCATSVRSGESPRNVGVPDRLVDFRCAGQSDGSGDGRRGLGYKPVDDVLLVGRRRGERLVAAERVEPLVQQLADLLSLEQLGIPLERQAGSVIDRDAGAPSIRFLKEANKEKGAEPRSLGWSLSRSRNPPLAALSSQHAGPHARCVPPNKGSNDHRRADTAPTGM
jgi:hypothetical protein